MKKIIQDELGNAAYAVPMVDIHDGWTQRPQIQEQPRDSYNESQRKVIGCMDAICVCSAAAGSGKTKTLIGRVLHGPCAPHLTALITFTNAVARVIQERLAEHGAQVGFAGTIHSFCLRLIQKYSNLLGYGPRIGVLDSEASVELLKRVADEQRFKGTNLELDGAMSDWTTEKPSTPAQIVVAGYRRRLRESNLVDFDTILHLAGKLLQMDEVRDDWKFQQILYDESQDMGTVHYELFKAMPATWKVMAGDRNQSIMSFLGGDVKNIEAACRSGATVIRLPLNYRCGTNIVALANNLIRFNGDPGDMVAALDAVPGHVELFDAGDEPKEICIIAQKIHQLQAADPKVIIAVLVRTNEHRRQLGTMLEGFGVQVEKRPESTQPRDWPLVRSMLNALSDPDNQMFCEALVRAWKPTDAEAIIKSAVSTLLSLNESCLHLPYLTLASDAVAYIAAKKPSPESLQRLTDAMELSPAADASISDLQLALAEAQEDRQTVSVGVVVSTYHSYKGREADVILMPGMEMELFPSVADLRTPEATAEAIRLCYVGVTRARKYLFLSWSATRKPLWGGKTTQTEPSIFLKYMGLTP